jgi:hypothetical protein
MSNSDGDNYGQFVSFELQGKGVRDPLDNVQDKNKGKLQQARIAVDKVIAESMEKEISDARAITASYLSHKNNRGTNQLWDDYGTLTTSPWQLPKFGISNDPHGMDKLPMPLYCNAKKILNSLEAAFGNDGAGPLAEGYKSVDKVVVATDLDRKRLQGSGKESISFKKQEWDSRVSELIHHGKDYSLPNIREAILNNMRKARGVVDKVVPWSARQELKIMDMLAKTERFVESLFKVPTNGSHVHKIGVEEERGIKRQVKAELEVIELTLLEALKARKRTSELRNGRSILDSAEMEAGILADNITTSESLYKTETDELNTEAVENRTELQTESKELRKDLDADLKDMEHVLHESNLDWVGNLEEDQAYVEEELDEKLNAFSRFLVGDVAAKKGEFEGVDSELAKLLAEVEEEVEALSEVADSIDVYKKELPDVVDENVAVVKEAGESAVMDLHRKAEEARDARDMWFDPKLASAKANAAQKVQTDADNSARQVDSFGESTAADLSGMQNTVVDAAAEVGADADNLLQGMEDMVDGRKAAVVKLQSAGKWILGRWSKMLNVGKDSQRDFEQALEDARAKAADDTYAVALERSNHMMDIERKIKELEEYSSQGIAGTVRRILGSIVETSQRAESDLGETKVLRADDLAALASAVEVSMNELRGNVVPASKASLLDAWNGAMEKAKTISNRTEDALSVALPEVQTQEANFEANVKDIMIDVNDAMFKSLNASQAELNSYLLELNKLVAQVREKAELSGGNIIMALSKEDAALRKKTQGLTHAELQMQESVKDAQADADQVKDTEKQREKQERANFIRESENLADGTEDAASSLTHLMDQVSSEISGAGSSEEHTVSSAAQQRVNDTQVGADDALHSGAAYVKATVSEQANVVGAARESIDEGARVTAGADVAARDGTSLIHDALQLRADSKNTLNEAIAEERTSIASQTLTATENAGQQVRSQISGAGAATGGMVKAGRTAVTDAVGEGKSVTAALLPTVNAAVGKFESSMEQLKSEQASGTANATASAHSLEQEEDKLTSDAAAESQLFNEKMDHNSVMMKRLLQQSKHKVADLLGEARLATKAVKMDQFDLEMAADLEALRQNLSKVEAPLSDEVSATWNVLLGYNASYQALEQEEHEFLAGADALQDEASSSETAGMQTFTREFELSQKMASDAAAEMRSENDAIFGNTSESVDVLSVLRSRALEQVKGSIADIEKGVGHSDRELTRVLELEQYQDNATLARVAGDIKAADDSLRQLRTWRDAADQDKKTWRDRVTAKFEEMGHALDVEALEAEEEKAAQEFAVQQAMNHLTTHLDEDLGTMSAAARSQIAALTAEAGAKIRELMSDTTLSDEEKARRLAEIKDRLRRDALAALRGGVSGDLHLRDGAEAASGQGRSDGRGGADHVVQHGVGALKGRPRQGARAYCCEGARGGGRRPDGVHAACRDRCHRHGSCGR